MSENILNILEQLSPIERKILPYLHFPIDEIIEKSGLDFTTVLRALKFLENKNIIKLNIKEKTIIDLGTNGVYYKKMHLPERKLLILLEEQNHVLLDEAKKLSKLSDNEFKVSLGVLKDKALITISNGKISLNATKSELTKKSLEEQLLDILPIEQNKLPPEQLYALENLKKRKDIVKIEKKNIISFELTEIGNKIAGKEIEMDLIEEVTPEIIKAGTRKKFRRYDIHAPVPIMYGGKKHFMNQAIEYGKKIWLEMGFKEMTGDMSVTSFWNFDALFTAQDHPVREMQDTFYIKGTEGKLPRKEIVERIKNAHEKGVAGSKGWQYKWNPEAAKKVLLRTHTTCLSAKTIAKLKKEQLPAKFFSIGKVFRNETIDWNHGFEFYQTEGIVIDPKANFQNLLGYLKEFYKKMGFDNVKFVPSFFPYTEPSVEIYVWNKEHNIWIETGGAGIFRPEVIIPLFGEYVPVLAWGQGFDRIATDHYQIKDLREMYKNDIGELRRKKFWTK